MATQNAVCLGVIQNWVCPNQRWNLQSRVWEERLSPELLEICSPSQIVQSFVSFWSKDGRTVMRGRATIAQPHHGSRLSWYTYQTASLLPAQSQRLERRTASQNHPNGEHRKTLERNTDPECVNDGSQGLRKKRSPPKKPQSQHRGRR